LRGKTDCTTFKYRVGRATWEFLAMRHPRVRLAVLATSALACALAAAPAAAQHRPGGPGGGVGGGAPHAAPAPRAAPAVPHFSAPVAPHFAAPVAPHYTAPVAPRLSAPVAPQITAPQVPRAPQITNVPPQITPRTTPNVAPRPANPQVARPAPEQSGHPAWRYVPRNLAGPTQPGAPGERNLTPPGGTGPAARNPGHALRDRNALSAYARAVPNHPNQTLLGATANRPFAALALRNPAIANRAGSAGGAGLARGTFQGKFAGRHFDQWRHRRFFPVVIGWLGPVFWPYAYNDFFDYTFYPHGYDTFWPYAYDDVYQGIFGRYAYSSSSAYAALEQPAVVAVPSGGGSSGGGRRFGADLCSSQVAGLTNWPVDQIAQTVEPNDAQRALLEDVRAATSQAVDILKTACPTDLPSTSTGRIEAMRLRLVAMLDAVRTVRPAFERFYQSLNDEQRARINALGPDEQEAQQTQRNLAQLCNERAAGVAGLPTDRIERLLRPDDAQRDALQELQDATTRASDLLKSECPTGQPLTVPGRLAAMEQRLDTMLRAVELVQPALERFYGALTDEQKERFNRFTPAQG
jgi:hypothetical protein